VIIIIFVDAFFHLSKLKVLLHRSLQRKKITQTREFYIIRVKKLIDLLFFIYPFSRSSFILPWRFVLQNCPSLLWLAEKFVDHFLSSNEITYEYLHFWNVQIFDRLSGCKFCTSWMRNFGIKNKSVCINYWMLLVLLSAWKLRQGLLKQSSWATRIHTFVIEGLALHFTYDRANVFVKLPKKYELSLLGQSPGVKSWPVVRHVEEAFRYLSNRSNLPCVDNNNLSLDCRLRGFNLWDFIFSVKGFGVKPVAISEY